MNWRFLGGALTVLATCSGFGGLFAGVIADESVSVQDQAHQVVRCFDGYFDACRERRQHDLLVSEWKGYGIEITIGSGLLLIVGISILAASWSSGSGTAEARADTNGEEVPSDDELAQADAVERELALRGIRLD